jgi:hypothetical protein
LGHGVLAASVAGLSVNELGLARASRERHDPLPAWIGFASSGGAFLLWLAIGAFVLHGLATTG